MRLVAGRSCPLDGVAGAGTRACALVVRAGSVRGVARDRLTSGAALRTGVSWHEVGGAGDARRRVAERLCHGGRDRR